jgi:MFS family permease
MSASSGSEIGRHWQTVLGAMIGVAFGPTGITFYTLGLFVKPLSDAFGWSRAQVSTGGLFLQAGLIVVSPLIGTLTDRFGPRRVGVAGMVGIGAGLIGLAAIGPNVLTLYAAWIFLALLAGGGTPVVWTRAVNRCFDKQRGLALGLSLSGTGIAAIFAPRLMGEMLAEHGWRSAYLVLAAVTLLIALPLVAFFLRESRDEDAGAAVAEEPADLHGATMGEALATAWFWRSAISFFLVAGGLAALIVHLTPMLIDGGRSPAEAAKVAGLLGVTIIVGRLLVGVLADRLPAALVGMAFLLLPALGCFALVEGQAVPGVLLIGLAAGAEVDLLAYLVSRRFGLRQYGRIYGWQLSAFLLGAGIAPIAMGAAQDHWGSYHLALMIDAGILVIGAVGIGSLRWGGVPNYRSEPA